MQSVTADPELSALFKNGIEAIENGIEDFESGNPKRLSSAIRNVSSGVLLILKEKLRRLSAGQAEFLLSKKISTKWVPDESGKLIGIPVTSGHQTVDTEELRERLQGQGVKLASWPVLKHLVEIRNDVEHKAPTTPPQLAREAIAKATAVLEEFLRSELNTKGELVFEKATWQRMLAIETLNNQIRDECRSSRATIELETESATDLARTRLRCGTCRSELVSHDEGEVSCRSCGAVADVEAAVLATLRYELAGRFYSAAKDGDSIPLAWCEQCNRESFVVDDDECLLCGEGREHTECLRCGNGIPACEQGLGGLCSWCAHMSAKDD